MVVGDLGNSGAIQGHHRDERNVGNSLVHGLTMDGDNSEIKIAAWLGLTAAAALWRVAAVAKGQTRLISSSLSR